MLFLPLALLLDPLMYVCDNRIVYILFAQNIGEFPYFSGSEGQELHICREGIAPTRQLRCIAVPCFRGLLRSYPDTERQRSVVVEHGESKRQANKRRSRGTAVCIIFRDWPGVRWPYGPWTGERLSRA